MCLGNEQPPAPMTSQGPSSAADPGAFRHGIGDAGFGDVTMGTDIPGKWSPLNLLPGTDPGAAGQRRPGSPNMPTYNHINQDAVMQLISALLQRQGADQPAQLSGGLPNVSVPGVM